jgi:predicted lactoylglutathione lyase
VTLGVSDLARSTKFYQALGWEKSQSSPDVG